MHENSNKQVLFVHGLAESSTWMMPMSLAFQAAGYNTQFLDYPSTRYSVEHLTEEYLARALYSLRNEEVLHVVAHSLGAVMMRYYLQNHKIPNIGRIVMLAPGNEGSPFLSLFRYHPLYPMILGPAGVQSTTGDECFACTIDDKRLPETGIISGCAPLNPFSFLSMTWPHDGMTTVQGTKLRAMKDHIVLPVSHDSMLFNPISIFQSVHFIHSGSFKHDS